MTRTCGNCTLCCKLLPVVELKKTAGSRCAHQRHTGCAIYAERPMVCRIWSCRWLLEDDTADLPRPDRSRYVIDMMPDLIRVQKDETGEAVEFQTVQVWCDPAQRDAWRTPELLAYIERRAAQGIATIVRFGSADALVVFAPALTGEDWHVQSSSINPALLVERKRRFGY